MSAPHSGSPRCSAPACSAASPSGLPCSSRWSVGGVIGLVNGWLVSFRGLEPFIVTLGMLALARGLVYAYGQGIPINPEAADTFAQIGQTTVVGIPVLTLIWIAVVLLDRVPAEADGVGTPGVCDR